MSRSFKSGIMARSNMAAHPGIRIKDNKTGKVVSIRLYYQPNINKGDRFTVNYLPKMGRGNGCRTRIFWRIRVEI